MRSSLFKDRRYYHAIVPYSPRHHFWTNMDFFVSGGRLNKMKELTHSASLNPVIISGKSHVGLLIVLILITKYSIKANTVPKEQ